MKNMKQFLLTCLVGFGLLLLVPACATKEKPATDKEVEQKSTAKDDKKEESKEQVEVSGNRTTYVHSLTSNPMTLHVVHRAKAEKLFVSLEAQTKDKGKNDLKDYEALLSAARLAGQDVTQLMGIAQKIAVLEMKNNVEKDISEEVRLELSLSAIKHGKYALAELFLDDLIKSKNQNIKAGAYNATGVIALLEGRVPEAVDYWKQAIKADGNYKPARLNLGFTVLKYADAKTAKSALDGYGEDSFAGSGLLVAERLLNNPSATDALCKKILAAEPNCKPTIYNCAVYEFQSNDIPRAKELLQELAKIKGEGGSAVEEKAFKLNEAIEKQKVSQKAVPKEDNKGDVKKKADEPAAAKNDQKDKGGATKK